MSHGHHAPVRLGTAGKMASAFIDSKLTPLLVITSVLLGLAAVLLLPREEEPQIKVPMIDVIVAMPGATAEEVETRATNPMEQLLWEIPNVEYVYSMTQPGQALVIVRFEVGQDVETSLVRLHQKLRGSFDRIPHGVTFPFIKAHSIDDVPIMGLTLHSETQTHLELRRIAAELETSVKQVPKVAETKLIGGTRRQIRVQLDPARLAARELSVAGVVPLITRQNKQFRAGGLTAQNHEVVIDTGAFLTSAEEVGDLVIGAIAGRPIHLREVADILDAGEDPTQYVFYGYGAAEKGRAHEQAAVTLTVAKRPGSNAVAVADAVMAQIDALKPYVVPSDVTVSVTRHYGETAAEKSNELLFHMAIAVVSVSLLIMFTLGFRESGIVAVAIPSTLALTLLVFYLYGFTLNRITLFALIFSIGILVDDAIVVVENIVRHLGLPQNKGRNKARVSVEAVDEVGNPTILATFTVIFAVVPMAFVGGLMGPYMRPIPIGASAAMFFSLVIAFIVTPWAAMRLLSGESHGHASHGEGEAPEEDFLTRSYRTMMSPLITKSGPRWMFLIGITVLLLASMGTVGVQFVKVKMLPFDNKGEIQVVVNAPEGSSLEHTARILRDMASAIREEPEVSDYQIYVGTSGPFTFNGLVRHYFLRQGDNVGDIQVNLTPKHHRDAQSHDVAKRIRPKVAEIAARFGARVAVAEVPPGPPVLQTLVAEVYGPTTEERRALAAEVKGIFDSTPGVVDVDWYVEADQPRTRFVVDHEKAAMHGIAAETIARTLSIAVEGASVDLVHIPEEREDVPLVVEIPTRLKSLPEDLLGLRVRSGDANALPEPRPGQAPPLVPLRELVHLETSIDEKTIHHKNLLPVTYVLGDVAGVVESPVYAIFSMKDAVAKLDGRKFGGRTEAISTYDASMPAHGLEPAIKWDGEWHITLEVFRDLGLAFGAVLILIYILMVGWFGSFLTPVIVMAAIPFSLIGILPAHGAMGVFFSATSMIGFMAGAGIVVRNSIILVDFIELRLREGMPIAEAVIDAGAVRFRPMLLTALAVVVGAGVILADPIFEGLAVALIFGEIASLFVSRMAVPVLYYLAYAHNPPVKPDPTPSVP